MSRDAWQEGCGQTQSFQGGVSDGLKYPDDIIVEVTPAINSCLRPERTVEVIFSEPNTPSRGNFPVFNHKFYLKPGAAEKLAGMLLRASRQLR